jgi:DNA invertase Pin-like site-specific DNA recombinase
MAKRLNQLVQAGVRLFFYLEDRERTLDSPTDKIMLSLTAFADELEREKAGQRTYDAMLRKARSAHVTGGRVFGYHNIDVPGPDGKRAYVVRRVTAGGQLDTLVAAIKEREQAREALRLELRSIERAGKAATLDLPAVERQLRAKLEEWKAVLRKHVRRRVRC